MHVEQYAVIGNPIEHSKSPLIHQAFAQQMGKEISYKRILAPLASFKSTVQMLIAEGYKGVNVTVPFKLEAYDLCNTHTERAFVAGAVNTLVFNGGHIAGDNTDGAGLVNDIEQNLSIKLAGKQVLLLGAGGAAQGVLKPLVDASPAGITVANRNVNKAHFMVKRLSIEQAICNITVLEYGALASPFDIIINATSAGLTDALLPISEAVFTKNSLAYDMMYGRETPFMAQARAAGAQVADGLGMLVEQAAEAFYSWHSLRPNTQPIIHLIRNS